MPTSIGMDRGSHSLPAGVVGIVVCSVVENVVWVIAGEVVESTAPGDVLVHPTGSNIATINSTGKIPLRNFI